MSQSSQNKPLEPERREAIDTRSLGQSIERADISGLRACVHSAARIAPHLGAVFTELAGGVAAFVGVGSPLSEAAGLGIFANVTDEDVAHLTDFYVARGTPPRVSVSPLASVEFPQRLARAGYVPIEYQSVLACAIETVPCERDERVEESDDPRGWGRASAAGFAERAPTDDETLLGSIIAAIPSVTSLQVLRQDVIVATAAMDVQGELAGLFAASTAPEARGRGLQSALIRDRIARARERGAAYVRASADVGSVSERNFRRTGFEVLYTRTAWQLGDSQKYFTQDE